MLGDIMLSHFHYLRWLCFSFPLRGMKFSDFEGACTVVIVSRLAVSPVLAA
jgi:hypothetical protein